MIDKVLEERGSRYGAFTDHADISQGLQNVLWATPNWPNMPLDARQALVVICDKMARMTNGDPDYDDNWVDIIGYATLVLNRIRAQERAEKQECNPCAEIMFPFRDYSTYGIDPVDRSLKKG